MPDISVVTPTRNRLALLRLTMASVNAQTLTSWEHIIVDDGSDDGTAEEVQRLAAADPRIHYMSSSAGGKGANVCRNMGIEAAQSDLVVLLDSDDLLRPGCLAQRVEVMRRNADLSFAVFRGGVFRQSPGDMPRLFHDLPPGDDILRFLCGEYLWQTTGPVWRRSYLRQIGGFDETLLSMQDVELHVRAICGGGKYQCFSEVDYDVRWQFDLEKTSLRHFRDPLYIEAAARVPEKLRDTLEKAGLLTWSRQRALLGLCFGLAENWMRGGHLEQAMRAWNSSCRHYGATWPVRAGGFLMLALLRTSDGESTGVGRLANKWKGWVRFRQELELLNRTSP